MVVAECRNKKKNKKKECETSFSEYWLKMGILLIIREMENFVWKKNISNLVEWMTRYWRHVYMAEGRRGGI